MNANGDDRSTAFERRTQSLLEESVTRIDSRVRSQLNRARHAAVQEAERHRSISWLRFGLAPAAGAIAATVLIAMVFWNRQTVTAPPVDLELLADDETFTLVESLTAEGDGAFYEWAAAQAEIARESSG